MGTDAAQSDAWQRFMLVSVNLQTGFISQGGGSVQILQILVQAAEFTQRNKSIDVSPNGNVKVTSVCDPPPDN